MKKKSLERAAHFMGLNPEDYSEAQLAEKGIKIGSVFHRKAEAAGIKRSDYPDDDAFVEAADTRGIRVSHCADEQCLEDALETYGIKLESLESDMRAKYHGRPLHPGVQSVLFDEDVRGFKRGDKWPGYFRFLKRELDALLEAPLVEGEPEVKRSGPLPQRAAKVKK